MFLVTKEFLKDLKEANRATVGKDSKGQGWIRITFVDMVRNQKVESCKSYLVDATFSTSRFDQENQQNVDFICCLMWLNHNRDKAKSAFNTLKENDLIEFQFNRHSSPLLEESDLVIEALDLIVRRDLGKTTRWAEFTLDSQVVKANSLASMRRTNSTREVNKSEFANA
jgi:hypothetical protein